MQPARAPFAFGGWLLGRAVVLSDGDSLKPEDFPQISGLNPIMDDLPDVPVATGPGVPQSVTEAAEHAGVGIMDEGGHLRSLEDTERDLIEFAIETYAGRMSEVARRLGVGRSTLYRKVREYELDVDGVRAAS